MSNDQRTMNGRQSQSMLAELKQGEVPFTYRFLGLRLRLAFTKRRFQRVEASFQNHLTDGQGGANGLVEVMEDSFSTLREEIDRIEAGQEKMKKRALPKVEELLFLHGGFMEFLRGFQSPSQHRKDLDLNDDETSAEVRICCQLPMLNQGKETTIAIKQLIAEFAGVPVGLQVHDLRSLHTLLVGADLGNR